MASGERCLESGGSALLSSRTQVGVEIYYVEVHGCAFGLRDEDSGKLIKKPWIIATTDKDFRSMSRKCSGDHQHEWLQGGARTAKSAYYPEEMAKKIVKKFADDFKKDTEMKYVEKELNLIDGAGEIYAKTPMKMPLKPPGTQEERIKSKSGSTTCT